MLAPIEDWKFNSGCRRISLDAASGLAADFNVNDGGDGVLNRTAELANRLKDGFCAMLSFELVTLSFSM